MRFSQCCSRLANSSFEAASQAAARFITTMSRPSSSRKCCRNDSRTMRFRRLRATARLQCFFEMARPSLARCKSLLRESTVNQRSPLRLAFSNTRSKDAASGKRLSFENRNGRRGCNGFGRRRRMPRRLRRQFRAALGATALQDETTGFGGHARTETVRSGALQFAGLIRAFHGYSSPGRDGQSGPVATKGRQGYAGPRGVSIESVMAIKIPPSAVDSRAVADP